MALSAPLSLFLYGSKNTAVYKAKPLLGDALGRGRQGHQAGPLQNSRWGLQFPPAAGGEDGTVRVWDLRSPGCQREYGSRAAVNTVVLHPNQGELISGGSPG